MKRRKVFYLILFLLVISVMPLSSATNKSSKSGSSSSQSQPEPVRVAIGFMNSEQDIENDERLTPSLRKKIINTDIVSQIEDCEVYGEDNCNNNWSYNDLNWEQRQIYDGEKAHVFLSHGQDPPQQGYEMESYNSNTGIVVLRGKGDWKHYKIRLKLIEVNGIWLIDAIGETVAEIENQYE